jgi:hypothetical protein
MRTSQLNRNAICNLSMRRISHDELWALKFGDGVPTSNAADQPANALFFSAGPNEGNSGLFGTLTPVAAELTEGSDQWKRSRYEASRTVLQHCRYEFNKEGQPDARPLSCSQRGFSNAQRALENDGANGFRRI